jgi:hypothetical protein
MHLTSSPTLGTSPEDCRKRRPAQKPRVLSFSQGLRWSRYECFLGRIGGRLDPFLRQLGRQERLETFTCFAGALREGQLDAGRTSTSRARASARTICATLDGVAQASRLNQFESPIHDQHGQLKPVLAIQLRGYAGYNSSRRCPLKCSGG